MKHPRVPSRGELSFASCLLLALSNCLAHAQDAEPPANPDAASSAASSSAASSSAASSSAASSPRTPPSAHEGRDPSPFSTAPVPAAPPGPSLAPRSLGDASSRKATNATTEVDPVEEEELATKDPRSVAHPRGGLLSSWDVTTRRWFVSARADVGYLFLRPRASFGYGIPHQRWWGVDLVPILSGKEAGAYAGLRWRGPRVEIRSGMLFASAFYRGSLPDAPAYDQRDLDRQSEDPADYWAWDSELTVSVPIGKSFAQSETQLLYLPFADRSRNLFVETMGVILAPPWALREQLRGSFPLTFLPGLFMGPAVELVWLPGRADPWVARAGASFSLSLYQDVQLRTDVLPTVWSSDTLGRMGSPWLTINVRLLWASN